MTLPRRDRALRRSLLAILVFFALAFTFDAMGVWMTPDSVEYLAMARSLAEGEGVHGFDGEPAGMWGPVFPALLAPTIALGLDVMKVLPWFHAGLWTLLLVGVVVPIAAQLDSWRWRWPLLAGTLIGAPVITVTSSLLPDATLAAGVFASAFLAERVRRGANPWGLILLASLLPLVKIIGVMVWPAVGWALLPRARERWVGSIVLLLPLALWFLRNLAHFGRVQERFPGAPRDFETVVRRTSTQLTNWFVPRFDSTDVLLVSGGVLVCVFYLVWRRLGRPSLPGVQTPWLLTAGSFLGLLWAGSAVQKVDFPDHRLMAPLFVLVLVLASRFGAALQRLGGFRIMVVGMVWTVLIGIQGVLATRDHLLAPQAVYFDPEDRFAAIVKSSMFEFDESTIVWSNIPEFVYWQTGRHSQWSEVRRLEHGLGPPGSAVRVIWFDFSSRDGLVHPREMRDVKWDDSIVREGVELWRGVVTAR